MKRAVLLALVAVAVESVLLRMAASHEVSMSLLAAGGTLPVGTLSLAAAAMIVRLAVRLVVPAFVARAVYKSGLRMNSPDVGV